MDLRTTFAVAALQIMLLALPCGALAGQPAAASGAATCAGAATVPATAAMRQAAADAVLCLVNAERAQRALRAVATSKPLMRAATGHSTDMVRRGYFSHVSPDGVSLRARVARAGYLRGCRRPVLGETIGWGTDAYATPAELVKAFMHSPEHKAIVLGRRYREIGVGLALGAPMEGMGGSGATLSLDFGRR